MRFIETVFQKEENRKTTSKAASRILEEEAQLQWSVEKGRLRGRGRDLYTHLPLPIPAKRERR
jgi:hypothetical protein